jgi:hypothetical protein
VPTDDLAELVVVIGRGLGGGSAEDSEQEGRRQAAFSEGVFCLIAFPCPVTPGSRLLAMGSFPLGIFLRTAHDHNRRPVISR